MANFAVFVSVAMVTLTLGGLMSNASDIPEDCENGHLCYKKPKDYEIHQQDIDDKFEEIAKKFNLNVGNEDDDDDLNDDDLADWEHNCRSVSEVLKPYTLKTNGTRKFVVQSRFYEQKFRSKRCAPSDSGDGSEGAQCFHGLTGSKTGICKTKETVIVLYVYNEHTNKIERVRTSFPSCCACSIN